MGSAPRIIGSSTQPFGVRRNFAWNTAGSLFYFFCQWLTTVLVVVLSDGFARAGILSYAMAMGNIFAPIALFSVRVYQVSDVSDRFSAANYVAFRLCTIGASAAITVTYLTVTTKSPGLIPATLVYLLFKADESFVDVLYGAEQRNSRMDYIGRSQALRGLVSVGAFSAILWYTGHLWWAILGMAASCMIVTVSYDLRRARLFVRLRPRIDHAVLGGLVRACGPIMISSLFLLAVVSLIRQYFGLAYGADALGLYSTIATPAVVLQAGALYLYSPSLVMLAERWDEGDLGRFQTAFARVLAVVSVALAASGVLVVFVGKWLLPLVFGPQISTQLHILPLVMVAVSLSGVLGLAVAVLVILRQRLWILCVGAVCFVVSVALAPVLIRHLYMNGINLALILGNGLALLVAGVGLRRCITSKYVTK